MKKKVYIFLFNGFSDWEIAYATPELKKHKEYELVYFTSDGNSALSMGGLNVSPSTSLNEIKASEIDMLILPGGTAWEEGKNREIDKLVRILAEENKTIAAICAATTYLGNLGLLDNVQHTSNDVNYLKAIVPEYKGENNYINSFAVTGDNIITANGIGTIEFACEIFKKLNLYNDTDLENWFQLFKNGVWKG
ncbi:MAG: DJ-1/PfpI family protein [Hyphomicrobiales bacterium]